VIFQRICVALLPVFLTLGGCAFVPPQNLSELQTRKANLQGANVVISINPQIQFDRDQAGRSVADRAKFSVVEKYSKLASLIKDQLKSRDVNAVYEVRNVNDLSLPSINDVIRNSSASFLITMTQERMTFVNADEASAIWLVELSQLQAANDAALARAVLFKLRYSAMGLFCLGRPLHPSAESTLIDCLTSQATMIADRLAANGYVQVKR
jgi:hypothetical protein